jgi:hypothetical protein
MNFVTWESLFQKPMTCKNKLACHVWCNNPDLSDITRSTIEDNAVSNGNYNYSLESYSKLVEINP